MEGRLMVRQVRPDNGAAPFLLALFTTLSGTEQEILELYGRRWAIETDLRTLKSTLCLDQITATTPNMVAKEIHMGRGHLQSGKGHDLSGSGAKRPSAPRLQLHENPQDHGSLCPTGGECSQSD